MRAILFTCILCLPAGIASSQAGSEEICETTAIIVGKAQEMRVAGKSGDETVASLTEEFSDRGDQFTQTAIPALVNNYVFSQPEAVLDQDLAEFWKQTCLTTDLSSVLPSQ